MNDPENGRGVIPSRAVRRIAEPVLVHSTPGTATGESGTMTVVPVMDGDRLAALEVRCRCGDAVLVECVYEEAP